MSRPSSSAYPQEFGQAELVHLAERRKAVGLDPPDVADAPPLVGLALSGGGIRSATFSLGVLQSLARRDLLKRIDYLSTVSGGGYIGSFFAALFARPGASAQSVRELINPDSHPESPPLDWLRRNGRYLAPNGGADIVTAAAAGLRNWVAVLLVVVLALLLLLLGLHGLAELLKQVPLTNELKLPTSFRIDLGSAGSLTLATSPWLHWLLPVSLFAVLPLGWGYWAIGPMRGLLHPSYSLILIAVVAIGALWKSAEFELQANVAGGLLAVSLLSLAAARSASIGASLDEARRRLTSWLGVALLILGAFAGLGLIDTLGGGFQQQAAEGQPGGLTLLGTLTALAALASQKVSALRKLLSWATGDSKLSLPAGVLIWLLALVAALSLGILVSALAHALLDGLGRNPWRVCGAVALLAAICWLIGRVWPFVNSSSHHALYAARLKRTYLGASNPERHPAGGRPVTEPLPGDDLKTEDYWSPSTFSVGAPLHLINVTINQTVSRRQGTVNRDRKGIPLAVGPCGFSAGVQHHLLEPVPAGGCRRPRAQPASEYWMFEGAAADDAGALFEKLSIGQWVAISGAAFTTGTGYHTSLASSLLTGLANVRLGYWWLSGESPELTLRERRHPGRRISRWLRLAFPVQMHLLDELSARFHGPGEPHWYLSDGGHFENMGGYELVRRRLPVMIVVDGEADPDYQYEGLASLVRKARNDFGAEIRFLDRKELCTQLGLPEDAQTVFGSLDDLRPSGERGDSRAHAAIAKVRYADAPEQCSVLIYLKPTLQSDAPADIREYQQRNPPFPQQPTLDQFFDEAQWESYRRLGLYVGDKVWALAGAAKGWSPGSLTVPKHGPWRD